MLENKFPQARREAVAALRQQLSVEAYLVLARADLHDNDSTSARQNLQKALALDPNNADAKAVQQEIQDRAGEYVPVH